MAEAGIAAFGSAIGVAITLAVVAFSLRQRRPHGPNMDALLDEQTEKSDTPESWMVYRPIVILRILVTCNWIILYRLFHFLNEGIIEQLKKSIIGDEK